MLKKKKKKKRKCSKYKILKTDIKLNRPIYKHLLNKLQMNPLQQTAEWSKWHNVKPFSTFTMGIYPHMHGYRRAV